MVVKVQYPNSKKLFDLDFLCVRKLTQWSVPEAVPFYDSACDLFRKEFDYTCEADHIQRCYKSVMVIN